MVKAKVEETPVAAKPKGPYPPIDSGVDESGLRWEDVSVYGQVWRVGEITTQDEDDAFDAAELPDDKINARLERRLRLVAAIKSPKTALDDIAAWPGLKTRSLMYVMDRINSLPPADAEGNA